MQRLRRTRPVSPLSRVRRAPRLATPDGRVVTATITVSSVVTEGSVTEEEFANWLSDAIERYHLWRAGWVGLGMVGAVTVPTVEHHE